MRAAENLIGLGIVLLLVSASSMVGAGIATIARMAARGDVFGLAVALTGAGGLLAVLVGAVWEALDRSETNP